MSKTEQNFWLDVAIFMALLTTTLTGFILWLVIPPTLDVVFLGFSRGAWTAAHTGLEVVGLAGIVIHIVWHWGWLKSLRGRALSGMPKKVRAHRVVDRGLWIIFITASVFGAAAGSLHFGDDTYNISVPDRLHVVMGVAWTILLIVHLVLHRKWIASKTQRYIHVNLRHTHDLGGQENI